MFKEFKLKFDNKTNQHKGYGFVEYSNRDIAMSAIWNLNGFQIGKRELKVSFASDNKQGDNLMEDHIRCRDSAEIKSWKSMLTTDQMIIKENMKPYGC